MNVGHPLTFTSKPAKKVVADKTQESGYSPHVCWITPSETTFIAFKLVLASSERNNACAVASHTWTSSGIWSSLYIMINQLIIDNVQIISDSFPDILYRSIFVLLFLIIVTVVLELLVQIVGEQVSVVMDPYFMRCVATGTHNRSCPSDEIYVRLVSDPCL